MEIVFRAIFVFFFLWIVTRAVGRSTLSELTTFELLLYVTMGDLVQQAVTQQDYSVTGGVLAVGTFASLTVVLGYVSWRWPRTRPIVHGVPIVVLRNGEPLIDAMRDERLTVDELNEAAREQGIRRYADIDIAVLETDGTISFFKRSESGSDGAPEGNKAA
jgi:uncharacterized membrane protein YcaP (DUF421 family)